ncbi:bifunctional ADP-dependent NAD(P)H-hydrate dehydratase/NAD(P)H-hydrate epimerase [Paralimibaculum aggregatum]|uniref:Bifunctional NAD(P)H-hydrate repair enzyme n=1 Tax=Paralimibaculum aggregatum TaxID=3036245 RepID=A0ABQ6LTM4_9RHOB|nr:NAD(P)H-hydrate epimerase [Limibaculum sp. NKW23]GMG85448.1 bifunctional ADP-dependent NAD(P)H-hydrate dehydratase/NAD(P)H-hydrate epimerase [Limibaculum sp. NKW23]
MTELLTAARMRSIEAAAIASGAVTGLELMERAGAGVVAAIEERLAAGFSPEGADDPDFPAFFRAETARVAVLAGPGNNGGDGFVIARLLAEAGSDVVVLTVALDPEALDRLPPDAAANARRWRAAGGAVRACPAAPEAWFAEFAPDLVIDAIFGTGLSRPVDGPLAALFGALDAALAGTRVVAVDIPSGICADSGRVLGAALHADLAVSFHLPKCGHHLAEGPAHCGRLAVADIGLPEAKAGAGAEPETLLFDLGEGAEPALLAAEHALAKRPGHKYDHGHALVLSGGVGRGGAARLAARAALRAGAGLVTLGCPPAALIENAARLDAVMLRPVADPAALAAALEDARINVLCLGPGLGVERARGFVAALLGDAGRPAAGTATETAAETVAGPATGRPAIVLDADALTALGPVTAALPGGRDIVLTPHEGEFARLFPDLHRDWRAPAARGPARSKLDAARAAAARAGAVLLLKGPDTVVAAPDGRAALHSAAYRRAMPWLATAGAGDVLAGIVAGLMARGMAAHAAAAAAAWLHTEAALTVGPGLIAEDLPEALPAVFRRLGL